MRHYISSIKEATKIKAQLLAEGIVVSESIKNVPNYKKKIVHLYKHETKDFQSHFTLPQEIILFRHPSEISRSIVVEVRGNPQSPWRLQYASGKIILQNNNKNSPEYVVDLPPDDKFDTIVIKPGITVKNITSKIGSNVLGLVISNYCSYFGYNKQCKYCEILPSYQEYRNFPTAKKELNLVKLASEKALGQDKTIKYIIATSGNLPTKNSLDTYDESVRMYIKLFKSLLPLKKKFKLKFHAALMPPLTLDLFKKLHEAGVDSICCNLEVWDPKLFEYICPGKHEYGQRKMLEALEYATTIFDQGCVLSNVIYGIQSLDKNTLGNKEKVFNPEKEYKINIKGLKSLLDIGVIPFYTIYHYGGYNQIGPIKLNAQAMHDFYLDYGKYVLKSHIVPESKDIILFDLFSLPNQLNNEGYFINKFPKESICNYY